LHDALPIYDHVGSEFQARVEPGLEGFGEPLVVRQADDVVDAVASRDFDGCVSRTVVDDQPLDLVDPGHLSRQVLQGRGQLLRLVEAGDLDDQLHAIEVAEVADVPAAVMATTPAGRARAALLGRARARALGGADALAPRTAS